MIGLSYHMEVRQFSWQTFDIMPQDQAGSQLKPSPCILQIYSDGLQIR